MSWIDCLLSLNYVKIAIPFFLVAIAVEAYLSWRRKLGLYRLTDTINSLSCGIMSQLVGVFVKGALVGCYALIVERCGVWSFAEAGTALKAAVAVFLLLAVDFFYYWFHRLAHVVNIGWATHVVHHQSEDYNLATALRQGAFQDFLSFAFYLPIACLGVPTQWYLAIATLNTTYQFWIHTQLVKKLPYGLEWIFNSPSHHRVHHGQNARYIDKNHAGMFIIWDRLFGTFQAEDEPAVYGITTPLASWNPLWAQVHYFVALFGLSRRCQRWQDRWQLWLQGPGWLPQALAPAPGAASDESLSAPKPEQAGAERAPLKFDCACGRTALILGSVLFGAALVGSVAVIFNPELTALARGLLVSSSVVLLCCAGFCLEGRLVLTEPRGAWQPDSFKDLAKNKQKA